MEQELVLDMLGRPITPGSFVVYPCKSDYRNAMRISRVLDVQIKIVPLNYLSPTGAAIHIKKYRVTVLPTERDLLTGKLRVLRKGTLPYPHKLLVIPDFVLSDEYIQIFKETSIK